MTATAHMKRVKRGRKEVHVFVQDLTVLRV